MKRISLLAAICLFALANKAPAPIYGLFEDLNKLIERAEFIVVAEILRRPQVEEMDMGGGGIFEIDTVKSIKGNVKLGKQRAYLRELPFTIGPPRDMAAVTQGFIPGQRYLLFLNKSGTHTHDENGKPPPVDFENENCEGDAVWISSTPGSSPTGYFDLESLNSKSVREAVVALLNHTATEQQKFATAVKAMIDSRAAPTALTQKITQAVWLDTNPEEAAKFYLSIFKQSSKDPNINRYVEVARDSKGTFTGVRLWIEGQDLVLLNSTGKAKSPEAAALTLNCDLQEEIDYYWDKLSAGGEKSKAGWVKDKFGVWWHIVPADLPQLLGDKYGNSQRVIDAMLKMEKIDSAALNRAAHEQAEAQQK
jgi:predicted 3-demethylubiquinone-9 3-methyltransferase (glyoxalase superfamily)